MPEFRLTITAVGEVRDADGNLIESRPVEAVATITEAQAVALGYAPQEES